MSAQSKPLPNELLAEMVNYVPLKIVHKKCVIPTNASLLLTNSILTGYLRDKIQKMLQFILEMSNPELYRNDEKEWCVTNADGTAMNSLDLLRHFCLNNVILQREGSFIIKDHLVPKDFQPLQFLGQLIEYAATCANPSTIGQYILIPAIDKKELSDILKMLEENKQKLDPHFVSNYQITFRVNNGKQKFHLRFSEAFYSVHLIKVGNGTDA